MAHKFKTASNGTIFCSKCGCDTYHGDRACNEKGHSFTMQRGFVFCTKCGKKTGWPSVGAHEITSFYNTVSEYDECSDKGHKFKVFPDGKIRCTKCGHDSSWGNYSCSN